MGNLYVHSPNTSSEGIKVLQNGIKAGKEDVDPRVYLFISEGYYFSAMKDEIGEDSDTDSVKYYRLKKPGRYRFIADSLKYLREYLNRDPYDNYASQLSIILNNSYWGTHIVKVGDRYEYSNSEYGYSFFIPDGWLIFQDNYEKGVVVLNIPNTEANGIIHSNSLAIVPEKNPPGATVDDFISDHNKRSPASSYGSIEELSGVTFQDYTFKNQSDEIRGKYGYLINRNNRFLFIFAATNSSYETNAPLFTEFVSTIKIE
jgi:hypothetical protein